MSLSAITSSFSPAFPAASAAVVPARAAGGGDKAQNGQSLEKSEQAQVDKLKERDRQVRQHEQAHLAAAGGLAMSGPNYSYQKGPDGVRYAVGGEVNIDTSPGRNPEETVAKARQIRAAALAPAEPSGQDRAVAAAASQMEMQAQMELARQPAGEDAGKAATGETTDGPETASSSPSRNAQAAVAAYAGAEQARGSQISVRA